MKDIGIDYNLSPAELEIAQKLVPELYNAETIGPMAVIRDWEKDFVNDMKRKFGFIVRAKPFKKTTYSNGKVGENAAKGTKEMYGIHSPLFGTDWLDDNAFADRYSCECGKMIGKIFKGRRCPECGTKVEYVDIDLRIFAYIVINDPRFAIIQPLLYKELDAFFGKANKASILSQILGFDKDMKLDGYYGKPVDVDPTKNPFAGIGMIEFHERFDEIMQFFYKKKKNRIDLYNLIMENREKIFVTKIPVYSAMLREVFFANEKFSYRKVDRCYNALYGNVCRINDETEIKNSNIAKLNNTLFRAQNNINQVFDSVFTSIHENEGLIRRNILGGRINNAARCVIVPDASLRSYEIRMPYVGFCELWKPDIVNLLVKLEGYSYSQAYERWYYAYREFDKKVYKIMNYILENEKGHSTILLNRNPTINMGSYLAMNVASVKDDYSDLSCSLPIQCLQSLNADLTLGRFTK